MVGIKTATSNSSASSSSSSVSSGVTSTVQRTRHIPISIASAKKGAASPQLRKPSPKQSTVHVQMNEFSVDFGPADGSATKQEGEKKEGPAGKLQQQQTPAASKTKTPSSDGRSGSGGGEKKTTSTPPSEQKKPSSSGGLRRPSNTSVASNGSAGSDKKPPTSSSFDKQTISSERKSSEKRSLAAADKKSPSTDKKPADRQTTTNGERRASNASDKSEKKAVTASGRISSSSSTVAAADKSRASVSTERESPQRLVVAEIHRSAEEEEEVAVEQPNEEAPRERSNEEATASDDKSQHEEEEYRNSQTSDSVVVDEERQPSASKEGSSREGRSSNVPVEVKDDAQPSAEKTSKTSSANVAANPQTSSNEAKDAQKTSNNVGEETPESKQKVEEDAAVPNAVVDNTTSSVAASTLHRTPKILDEQEEVAADQLILLPDQQHSEISVDVAERRKEEEGQLTTKILLDAESRAVAARDLEIEIRREIHTEVSPPLSPEPPKSTTTTDDEGAELDKPDAADKQKKQAIEVGAVRIEVRHEEEAPVEEDGEGKDKQANEEEVNDPNLAETILAGSGDNSSNVNPIKTATISVHSPPQDSKSCAQSAMHDESEGEDNAQPTQSVEDSKEADSKLHPAPLDDDSKQPAAVKSRSEPAATSAEDPIKPFVFKESKSATPQRYRDVAIRVESVEQPSSPSTKEEEEKTGGIASTLR